MTTLVAMYVERVPNRSSPPAIVLRESYRRGEHHMRRTLAPILFDDEDRAAAAGGRASIVAPAQVSARAQRKAARKRTDEGDPVHSFQTLLRDLSTIAKNRVQPRTDGAPCFDVVTRPTPLHQRALELLGVSL